MTSIEERLQVVVLKCPYANWKNPVTRKTFNDVISLKLDGYHDKHFFGVMPIDGADFLTDHILVCWRDDSGDLVPILGVKSLSYEICAPFFTDFTIESFLKKGEHWQHLERLNQILKSCEEKKQRISYYSSWTISPSVMDNRALITLLKDLFTACTVLHHREEGISELLGLGVPKFRTEHFFYKWGFERVEQCGHGLPNIPFRVLGGIDGVFIHLKKYSDFALSCAEKLEHFWKNRISIGVSPRFTDKLSSQVQIPERKTGAASSSVDLL